MKSATALALSVATSIALVVGPAHRAVADDETDDVEIKIEAPLDATDCPGTPPTITVLGRKIDITGAKIGAGEDDEGAGDCITLVAGQPVEVGFASDAEPLVATTVEAKGDSGNEDPQVKAPLQMIDPTTKVIVVLGLSIDVSGATLGGANDDGSECDNPAVDLSQLMVGQFVEVELDAAKFPALVARQLEVKNFSNVVDVEVEEPDGEVGNVDEGGSPLEDIDVAVSVKVKVAAPAAGRASHARRVKVLHFRTRTSGRFKLAGLPTGRAKIVATRHAHGATMTGRRRVVVKPNTTRTVRLVLHRAG